MSWTDEPRADITGGDGAEWGRTSLPFKDRAAAGEALARRLGPLELEEPLVLALPRGGLTVAYEVARQLGGTLDVLLTRKIGAPFQPELGVGAVAEGGEPVFDERILSRLGLRAEDLAGTVADERTELDRRGQVYRGGRPLPSVADRDVVVTDDGLATGGTARAALRAVRDGDPRHLVLAAPVSAPDTAAAMRPEADTVVILATPSNFHAVGQWYERFGQLTDADVVDVLERSRAEKRTMNKAQPETLRVPAGEVGLSGDLAVPDGAVGVIVFAHGSGSSRHSPRNRAVAASLQHAGFATLLFDLLTPEEDEQDTRTAQLRFDIDLLSLRLSEVVRWVRRGQEAVAGLPLGLFGASTGAAAALVSAADVPGDVAAVVSRGGRPDLAGESLGSVRAPTLLIVGGRDVEVMSFNEDAAARLAGDHDVAVVPGAGHLFPEPGALDRVSELASHWFARHLGG